MSTSLWGSPEESSGFILWGSRMSLQNLVPFHIVDDDEMSLNKWKLWPAGGARGLVTGSLRGSSSGDHKWPQFIQMANKSLLTVNTFFSWFVLTVWHILSFTHICGNFQNVLHQAERSIIVIIIIIITLLSTSISKNISTSVSLSASISLLFKQEETGRLDSNSKTDKTVEN